MTFPMPCTAAAILASAAWAAPCDPIKRPAAGRTCTQPLRIGGGPVRCLNAQG